MLNDYVVIDLEMTGTHPKRDSITEIGAIRVKDGEEKYFETLVKPRTRIGKDIEALTGITNEMVETAPEIESALIDFLEFSGDAPLIGHMISMDYAFLKQAAINLDMVYEREVLDTLKLSRSFLKDLPSYRLKDLSVYYGMDQGVSHRALYDAKATNLLFKKLYEEFFSYDENAFKPKKIKVSVKKQTKATKRQIRFIERLCLYHGIEKDAELYNMTRSEASRYQDKIITKYGTLPKEIKEALLEQEKN